MKCTHIFIPLLGMLLVNCGGRDDGNSSDVKSTYNGDASQCYTYDSAGNVISGPGYNSVYNDGSNTVINSNSMYGDYQTRTVINGQVVEDSSASPYGGYTSTDHYQYQYQSPPMTEEEKKKRLLMAQNNRTNGCADATTLNTAERAKAEEVKKRALARQEQQRLRRRQASQNDLLTEEEKKKKRLLQSGYYSDYRQPGYSTNEYRDKASYYDGQGYRYTDEASYYAGEGTRY